MVIIIASWLGYSARITVSSASSCECCITPLNNSA